jgi:hypothetical protein
LRSGSFAVSRATGSKARFMCKPVRGKVVCAAAALLYPGQPDRKLGLCASLYEEK